MLVIIGLIVISIFFPPMAFVLVIYILYLFLTKTKRRNRIIFTEIDFLIKTGREHSELKHLYYESAKSFAEDQGAYVSPDKNDPENDYLAFRMMINENLYRVSVQRWESDGTILSVIKI